MLLQYGFLIIVIISAVISIVLGVVSMRFHWQNRMVAYFTLLMFVVAGWLIVLIFFYLSRSNDMAAVWHYAGFIGIVLIPPLFLIFTLHYTGREKWLTSLGWVLIFIIPVTSIIVALTNRLHGLLYQNIHFVVGAPLSYIDSVITGPYDYVHLLYSYLVVLFAVVLLLQLAASTFRLYRRQAIMVASGAVLVLLINILDSVIPLEKFNHTLVPIGFLLVGIIFFGTIYRYQLLNVIPIARDMLIESISDAMLVLNAQDWIVDINLAAQKIFRINAASVIGHPIQESLPLWRDLLDLDKDQSLTQTEIDLDQVAHVRHYHLRISPILDRNNRVIGRLILLRDITPLKQLELELSASNEALKAQLEEINRLQKRLQEQIIRDPLTDLFNRRYLDETLQREIASVRREQQPMSVLMIDLDHFKRINDAYGHVNGDIVLIELSKHLVESVRGSDMVYRYGGEEFMILMKNTTTENACQRAEALRASVEAMEFHVDDQLLNLTISIGVATYPTHSAELQGVIEAADAALYRAKAGGRNWVVVAAEADVMD
jgi:diguanylate cyclase (GGDEF)-like protein/PAS domain S-box-containing protein